MNKEILVLICMTFILIAIGYQYYRRHTCFKVALYAISLYAFSSVMSIVFYFQPLAHSNGQLNGNISFFPSIYWLTLFLITLVPLFQFDHSKVRSFKYNPKILDAIAVLGFLVSIIPFFEQILLAPAIMGGVALEDIGDTMVSLHDDATLDNMSFLGRNGLRLNIAIYDLSFVILFVQFLQKKKSYKILLCCFVIIATRNLTGLIAGHRSAAIEVVMKLILIAIIAYPLIGDVEKKTIRKFMGWAFGIVGVVFAIITIGRQMFYSATRSEDFTLTYFLSWYAGEGLVNFSQFLPLMKHTAGGQFTCWYFLYMLGQNPPEMTPDYMYGKMTALQGIPQNIFYTYIGNVVQDFGFIIAAILLSILALIFKSATREKGMVMKVSTLFLLIFYSSVILQGVTSYCYNGDHGKFLIWNILVYFFLRIVKM